MSSEWFDILANPSTLINLLTKYLGYEMVLISFVKDNILYKKFHPRLSSYYKNTLLSKNLLRPTFEYFTRTLRNCRLFWEVTLTH